VFPRARGAGFIDLDSLEEVNKTGSFQNLSLSCVLVNWELMSKRLPIVVYTIDVCSLEKPVR